MTDFKGQAVLITGASRGVGRQIALAMAQQGARVFAHARSLESLAPLAAELSETGAQVELLAAELSERAEVERMIATVEQSCGCPDVIYNNAAIMTPWTDAHMTSAADYHLSFAVNVVAPILICDAFIEAMKERGSGRIINVTSGIESIRELLPYSVSKAALDRYVRDVSPSLADTGVVMSLLDPGWLRTDLGGDQAPNAVESVLPGALIPAQLPDAAPSGQLFAAQAAR